MRVLLGSLGFAVGLAFVFWQTVVASPANPTTTKAIAPAISTVQDIVYTYRRTKHGFQRCYHRNRFGTRSWRSLFSSIPDC
jgi:hypothetical protein